MTDDIHGRTLFGIIWKCCLKVCHKKKKPLLRIIDGLSIQSFMTVDWRRWMDTAYGWGVFYFWYCTDTDNLQPWERTSLWRGVFRRAWSVEFKKQVLWIFRSPPFLLTLDPLFAWFFLFCTKIGSWKKVY